MSRQTISAIFEEYQELRKPRMKKVLNLAYQLTRLQAWDGLFMRMAQRYALPWVGDARAADHFADIVKAGVKLDFVPTPEHRIGTCAWDDEIPERKISSTAGDGKMGLWQMLLQMPLQLSSVMTVFLGCAFLGPCFYFIACR